MTDKRSRKTLALVAGAVVVAAAGVATTVVANASASECRVSYAVTAESETEFTASVTVRNLGEPLSPWTLRWTFTAGQQVVQGWNGVFSQNDEAVTVTNARRTGALQTDQSEVLGFTATWDSTNPAPTGFTLNGQVCTGFAAPGATPTTTAPSARHPGRGPRRSPATIPSAVAGDPVGPVQQGPASSE